MAVDSTWRDEVIITASPEQRGSENPYSTLEGESRFSAGMRACGPYVNALGLSDESCLESVDDNDLECFVRSCANLKSLDFTRVMLRERTLRSLMEHSRSLRSVKLGTLRGNVDLSVISTLIDGYPDLEVLGLRNVLFADVPRLSSRQFVELDLPNCPGLHDRQLNQLLGPQKNLESLCLRRSLEISRRVQLSFVRLCKLRRLDVSGNPYAIDDVHLSEIAAHCPNLEYLSVEGSMCLRDSGVATLSALQNLHFLNVSNTRIGLTGIQDLRNIRVLMMRNWLSMDIAAVARARARMPALQVVDVHNVDLVADRVCRAIVDESLGDGRNFVVFVEVNQQALASWMQVGSIYLFDYEVEKSKHAMRRVNRLLDGIVFNANSSCSWQCKFR